MRPCPVCGKAVKVRRDAAVYAHLAFGEPCHGPHVIKKNPHAQALGRLGGKIGGKAKSHKKTLAARRNAKLPRKRKAKQ